MYPVERNKNTNIGMIQKAYRLEITDGASVELEYLQFPKLAALPQISHLFSTRVGGVSKGHLGSLNFSYTRGDHPECVLENYRRAGLALGCRPENMIASQQTHTTNIRIINKEDAGKGIVRERDYEDIDGLITHIPGLTLVCYYADCVPLYFVDPVKRVIGLAHSGWRGTVAGMGARMVERMRLEYGCRPEDITAAIGPSICRDCYEINEEVAEEFRRGFWSEECISDICSEIHQKGIYGNTELLVPGGEEGKYQLDLWLANLIVLRSAGIELDKVDMTDICTCCNPNYLHSHRASKGMRGNLAAFLMLREGIY